MPSLPERKETGNDIGILGLKNDNTLVIIIPLYKEYKIKGMYREFL